MLVQGVTEDTSECFKTNYKKTFFSFFRENTHATLCIVCVFVRQHPCKHLYTCWLTSRITAKGTIEIATWESNFEQWARRQYNLQLHVVP